MDYNKIRINNMYSTTLNEIEKNGNLTPAEIDKFKANVMVRSRYTNIELNRILCNMPFATAVRLITSPNDVRLLLVTIAENLSDGCKPEAKGAFDQALKEVKSYINGEIDATELEETSNKAFSAFMTYADPALHIVSLISNTNIKDRAPHIINLIYALIERREKHRQRDIYLELFGDRDKL